jgi:hypothetical protein
MGEGIDWRDVAFETYRTARQGLEKWQKLPRADLEYWIEELREALLDLKQATIDDDETRGLLEVDEVKVLMIELIIRAKGEDA